MKYLLLKKPTEKLHLKVRTTTKSKGYNGNPRCKKRKEIFY